MVDGAALYTGRLRHRRHRPRPHAFTYDLFMAFLDIDRLDTLMQVSPFTSRNHFNWAAFDDRDHLGDPALALRERLRLDGARAGHVLPAGPIYLLTHLRYLGYGFNPIAFYFCCDASGQVDTVVGEVHNTFGEQCTYWLPPSARDASGRGTFRFRTPKTMHVSPFMGMDVEYRWTVGVPGGGLGLKIESWDAAGLLFDAAISLRRREWTAANRCRALFLHPLATMQVFAKIYWQALRLWLKKVPYVPHPRAAALAPTGDVR